VIVAHDSELFLADLAHNRARLLNVLRVSLHVFVYQLEKLAIHFEL